MGSGSGAEDDLALWGDASLVVGDLDDSGLDVGAFNTLLDFADVEGGDGVGGGFPEDARNVPPGAGGGDDVDAGASGDVFEHTDVAAEVDSGNVNDGPDALGVGDFQVVDASFDYGITGDELGVDLLDAGGGYQDVLVGEGEAHVGGVEGAED